ncbi:cyclin-dependent kinase-like 2, partial [Elysia marginata]
MFYCSSSFSTRAEASGQSCMFVQGGPGPGNTSTGTVGGGGAGAGASTTGGATGARGMERYENLGLVGEGSYGMVLKCRHKDTGQLVAIKKFLESEDDKMVKKIAMREVKMLKQLQHDNLVNLIETFRRRKRLYLVFEFVDHTVLDELEKCPNGLDENTARKILWQVLKGTEFCHFHNIIHRDIKPENILVSKSGIVKICDFGFARTLAQPGEAYTDYVATRWYRAPELLVGDTKYGRAVDIWAVGCLLSEMLTGEPLFPGDSDIDQLYHIIRCFGNLTPRHKEVFQRNPLFVGMRLPEVRDIVPLEKKFTRVSTESLALMKQCLQLDPDKRPTCSELLKHNLFQRDGFGARFAIELKQKLHQENVSNPLLKNRSSGVGRSSGPDAAGKGGASEEKDSNENSQQNQQANNSSNNNTNTDSGKGGGGGTIKKKKKVEDVKNGIDDKSTAKRKIIESENSNGNNPKPGVQSTNPPHKGGPSPSKPKSTTPLGSHSSNTQGGSVTLPPAGGLMSHVASHANSPDAGGPLTDRGDNRDRDKGENLSGGGGGRSSSREFPASPQQMVTTSIPPINNSLNLQGRVPMVLNVLSPAMARLAPGESSWSPRHPPLLNGNRRSSF